MGNITQTIRTNGYKKNSNVLLNIRLPKLRDYFASFKAICDSYSMDLTQFEQIFGTGQASFVIWDMDNNGLIDSLELFSGIAIFSDTKFQDKIRFLFDVFDFNETEYLEPIQLQLLIYCAVNASFKIFSISNQLQNQEIQSFVKQLFPQINKITVANLINKSKQNAKIKQFFQLLQSENNFQSNQK